MASGSEIAASSNDIESFILKQHSSGITIYSERQPAACFGQPRKRSFLHVWGLPGLALVAFSARHRGFDRYPVAGFHFCHGRTDFLDYAGALVSYSERVFDNLAPDLAFCIIVDVGAADPDSSHPDENIVRIPYFRCGDIPHLHPAYSCQHHSLHAKSFQFYT